MVAKTGLLLATGVGSRSANDSMAHKRPKNQWSRKIVHGPSVTVTIDFGAWSGTRVLDFGAQPRGSSDSFAVYLRIDIRTGVRSNHEGNALLSEVEICVGGTTDGSETAHRTSGAGKKTLHARHIWGGVSSTLQFLRLLLRTTRDERMRATRVEGAGVWIGLDSKLLPHNPLSGHREPLHGSLERMWTVPPGQNESPSRSSDQGTNQPEVSGKNQVPYAAGAGVGRLIRGDMGRVRNRNRHNDERLVDDRGLQPDKIDDLTIGNIGMLRLKTISKPPGACLIPGGMLHPFQKRILFLKFPDGPTAPPIRPNGVSPVGASTGASSISRCTCA